MKNICFGFLRGLCWAISPFVALLVYRASGDLAISTSIGILTGSLGSSLLVVVDLIAEDDE